MKIDVETINVLKNFSKINAGIIIPAGNVIKTLSRLETVKGIATVPTHFPRKFAIYNLDRFIGVLSLFNDPDLEFTDTSVIISDNNRNINYMYADESTLEFDKVNKEIKIPDNYCKFTLTNDIFKDLDKAAGVLSVPDIVIKGDGNNLYLQAADVQNPSSDRYSINIGNTDKVFSAVYKIENFKFLPKTYDVQISSAGITHYVGENIEYFAVVEEKTSFFK
jgi:hypothetical protein